MCALQCWAATFCDYAEHFCAWTLQLQHSVWLYGTLLCVDTSAASLRMKAEGNLAGSGLPQSWRIIRRSPPSDQGVHVEQGLSKALQQHEQLLCLLRAQLLHKGQGPGSAARCHSSSVTGMCMRYQQAVSAMVQDAAPVQLTGDHFFISAFMLQQLSCRRDGTSAAPDQPGAVSIVSSVLPTVSLFCTGCRSA